MVRAQGQRSRQRGLTLIEILIYLGILLILLTPLTSVTVFSIRATSENDTMNKVAERNRAALNRVSAELRLALSATVAVAADNKSVTVTLADGFDGVNLIPGPRIRFEVGIVADEQPNGVDDNGNGLADEGELRRVDVATSAVQTICQGLDLAQSSFQQNGASIIVTIANAGRMARNQDGTPHVLTRSLTVTPRN